jgi:hypothetical protein
MGKCTDRNTFPMLLSPWLTPCLILQAAHHPVRVFPGVRPCGPDSLGNS